MKFTGLVVALTVLEGGPLPRTEVTLEDGVRRATFVVPGSNGPPVVVGGVPAIAVGDTWTVDLVDAPAGLVPRGLGAGLVKVSAGAAPPPWVLNGLHYGADALPLPFVLHADGAADVGGVDVTEPIVEAALAQWSTVGCATFAFRYDGRTDARFADDGINALSWEETTWEWGESVLGLTATRFGVDASGMPVPVGADIVFNGVDWSWTAGPGDAYAATPTLNLASVLVHELGHVTGMDHESDLVTSTMFYAYLGGDWMASLSGDDRRGLCENYPSGVHECDDETDCAALGADRVCADIDGVRVCDEVRDAVGATCSRTSFNCADSCVFTNAAYTDGYCTIRCAETADCAEGYACGSTARVLPDPSALVCIAGAEVEDTGGEDTAEVPDDTGAPAEDTAGPPPDEPEGCGCASGPASPLAGVLAALVLSSWRRRSCSRSSPSRSPRTPPATS